MADEPLPSAIKAEPEQPKTITLVCRSCNTERTVEEYRALEDAPVMCPDCMCPLQELY
jgi:uncharacterized CHY-type Zn-finger protein